MKIGYVAYRNMVSKPLNLLLSLLLLILSISLVTFTLQLNKQLNEQLNKNIAPFDMVIGAKGSPLQLVLSSILHIDAPTGNISLEEAMKFKKHPFIAQAIPVSYGDNFKGYRILGTEPQYLEKYNATLAQGELFEKSFEVIVGSTAANQLGLNIGDTFTSAHGLTEVGGEDHDEHPFTVTGILKPTGSVIDKLLISNLESIWEVHGHHDDDKHNDEVEHENHDDHDHEKHDDEHDEAKEITSLLIKFKNPLGMVQLPRYINENTQMQAALTGFEIQRLTGLLGSGTDTVKGIALAILLVSGLSIFISLLKTIRERRQELALLRTYGLRTRQLLKLVVLEGFFLALLGFILGWIVGRLGILIISDFVRESYGYVMILSGPTKVETFLLLATLLVAIIAVFLASISIFKLNVSKTLSNA